MKYIARRYSILNHKSLNILVDCCSERDISYWKSMLQNTRTGNNRNYTFRQQSHTSIGKCFFCQMVFCIFKSRRFHILRRNPRDCATFPKLFIGSRRSFSTTPLSEISNGNHLTFVFRMLKQLISVILILFFSRCKLRSKLRSKLREIVQNTDNFTLHRQRGNGDNFLLYVGRG